ncbi:hypothetical protein HBB16_21540 [Pseudonocardia sp. MCCB 268]|nr:hypothetical protein [Pseudonocardia cytotoxica]
MGHVPVPRASSADADVSTGHRRHGVVTDGAVVAGGAGSRGLSTGPTAMPFRAAPVGCRGRAGRGGHQPATTTAASGPAGSP